MTSPSSPMARETNRWGGRRIALVIVGGIVCACALASLVGGGWALWKDRVDRDGNGFVSLGTSDLRTETYAIVGDLSGDGPSWLYGSTVIGDTRVRATSSSTTPLFIGIARKADVSQYLSGAGYATIYNFEVTAGSTHPGAAPSGSPSHETIWAASTQGTGQQTLFWTPRDGDWSIVFMNTDANAGVAVLGDASAKLPLLPWVAGALLVIAAALGLLGTWMLIRGIRVTDERNATPPDESQDPVSPRIPVGAHS